MWFSLYQDLHFYTYRFVYILCSSTIRNNGSNLYAGYCNLASIRRIRLLGKVYRVRNVVPFYSYVESRKPQSDRIRSIQRNGEEVRVTVGHDVIWLRILCSESKLCKFEDGRIFSSEKVIRGNTVCAFFFIIKKSRGLNWEILESSKRFFKSMLISSGSSISFNIIVYWNSNRSRDENFNLYTGCSNRSATPSNQRFGNPNHITVCMVDDTEIWRGKNMY